MRLLSATLLASSLLVAAEPAPIADLRVADGKDLIAHWQATPVGRTWADPALEPLRKQWSEFQTKARTETGATITEWLAATSKSQVLVTDATGQVPGFRASTDLGALAAPLVKALRDKSPKAKPATVPGADEALADESGAATLARFGTTLVLFGGGLSATPAKPAPITADAVGYLHLDPLVAWLERLPLEDREHRKVLDQMVTGWKTQAVHEAEYRLRLLPEGVLEEFASDGKPAPGALPVDQALVARLHGSTTAAVAVGLDLSAAWAANRAQMLTQWAPMVGRDPSDLNAVEAEIDRTLATFGIPVTIGQLAQTKGTLVFAISPGVPVPGITIVLPRSPAVDQLVELGATKAQVGLPAEGASTPILVPGMPLPLVLARDAGHWTLTTDSQQADAFLAGKPGGWAETPAWKLALSRAPAGAPLIGASDTPAFVRLISGLAGMALGMQRQGDPAVRQALLAGLNRLAKEASTGYVVAGARDGKQVLEMRSVTGIATLPVIAAGVMVGMGKATAVLPGAQPAVAPAPAPAPGAKPAQDPQSF